MRTFSVTNRMGAIAVIAAAAIALAACGGGGGLNEDEAAGLKAEVEAAEAAAAAALAAQKAAEEQAAADKAAREAAEAAAAAARTSQETAEAAQQAAETERDAAVTARQEAEAAQALAEEAQAAAQEAEEAAEEDRDAKIAEAAEAAMKAQEAADQAAQAARDLAAAQEARERAETERDAALAAQTTAEREKAAAERELATAQQQLRAAQTAAETARQAAERARLAAEQQQEQLQQQLTEAEQAELRARASSFGTVLDLGDGGAEEMGPATVSWPRGGSLTFRPSGTLTPGSAAPSVPGGWRSASFTGQSGTAAALIDETVYLYTNIQAPGNRAFWKVHGLSEVMTDALESMARGSSATPTSGDTDTSMEGRQYTGLTVSGSLNGASGRFTCDCTGTVGSEADGIASHVTFAQGVPDFSTVGSWTFTPSNIANGYRVDSDDAFLYFGIWSSIPDNISGATYNFRYISGGGAESGSDLANFDALTGSATFRGGAVGRYVTQGQIGGQNAKIGTFTATATLNADFSDGDMAGTLSGSITDFREGGSALEGWRVTLGSATDVGVAAAIADAAVAGTAGGTVANIGGLPVAGSWGATFYGSDNEGVSELTDTAKYPATRYPPVDLAGVAGWFDATNTAASVAGAFAATPSR